MSTPPRPEPSATLAMRLRAIESLGWTATCLDPETRWLWRIEKGGRSRVLCGPVSTLNDASAARLAADKFYTSAALADAGFPVPEGARCLRPGAFLSPTAEGDPYASHRGLVAGLALAERRGYPLVVKPNRGSRGRVINLVEDREALAAAVEEVWAMDEIALVQPALPGVDLRVDLLDGELLLAYLRRPLRLVGDGRSSVEELLAAVDARAAEPSFRRRLSADPLWRRTLSDAGLSDADVPRAGHALEFPAVILNLNRCCSAEIFAELPAPWIERCAAVARCLRLRHCGVDLRLELPSPDADPLACDPEAATVLEVNASPALVQVHRMGAVELAEAAELRVTRAILAEV
jgi:glutathione synthase/RimK-type ligase-like ATP-grasp enzyme